ncbi:GIY-YIG nuclease family protein [uncultured Desulfosarcina sp.]|uniref:GIY-YIG nuclease family protein n=1 Tax=uncultured Desulfosarcina sp. TaxID=218289 RepID=UPI0029C93D6F|nr:GIY-YIG nuclease family protein [uncultured Desulfosarcina sp.]
MSKPEKNWVVYLARCADNSLYCGISSDLEKRLESHNHGTGARYTRSRRPVKLLAASGGMSKSDALKLEYRIKRTPADKKLSVLENAGQSACKAD